MEQKPFVSFCFSTFRRPAYLKSTIESILIQSYQDFEIIVSDNDTEQSAEAVVSSYGDSRVKYFANGANLGMKKSFNKSLERSSGEYIVMIADDDPVYPDMLQTLYGLQNEFTGYGMYMGGCDWFCTDHEVGKLYNFNVGTNSCLSNEHDLDHKIVYTPDEFLLNLFGLRIFPHYLWSTVLVKRDILISVGGVPDYGTPFLGDYAYMAVIGSVSGCVTINRSLGRQTLHRENFGRQQNDQLETAAIAFPEFIKRKLSHLERREEIRKAMLKFTAMWLVSHMSFLNHYYSKTGAEKDSLRAAERKIFKLNFIKKYRFKYYMKKNFPLLHDWIIHVKRKIGR